MDSPNKLKNKLQITSILSFDFCTLYAKVSHDKLLKVLNKLIDFSFKKKEAQFIIADGDGAKWAKERRAGELVITKSTLLHYLNLHFKLNCYFKLGNRIFRQIVRIPIGLDP